MDDVRRPMKGVTRQRGKKESLFKKGQEFNDGKIKKKGCTR